MLLTDKSYERLPEFPDFHKILRNESLENCTAKFTYIHMGKDKHIFYSEKVSSLDGIRGNFKFELDFFLGQLSELRDEYYDVYIVNLLSPDKADEYTNFNPFDPWSATLTTDIRFKVDGRPIESNVREQI